MDDVDAQAAELVADLEDLLEQTARPETGPVAVALEVWAAWYGLGGHSAPQR